MRILAIRGKNLASLEGEFTVDFMLEPLRSAGIFAITGSTGSGKSTLLDAICLALFNDTPRIHRADNADIADVKGEFIKQRDSRNILRRGAVDGYAEVDFISLSGDKFRARWSVRRSRDMISGSLRNVMYQVFNLTDNVELPGSRSELLSKVRGLIGLSFEQFTRAVMLAQGDFATFLKAGKNEKAELLEKLTGTDVYSRISAKIFEHTREADGELKLITGRIKDVEVLTDERVLELTAEREVSNNEIVALDGEIKILSIKSDWLKVNEGLVQSVSIAQEELVRGKAAIEEAKPRFDYIARTDSVQDIRDSFMELLNNISQLGTDNVTLSEQQGLGESNNGLLIKAKDLFAFHQLEHDRLSEHWLKMEPQIREARRLDVLVGGVIKNLTEIEGDLAQVNEQSSKCLGGILSAEKEIVIIEESQSEISAWFDKNKRFSELIPKIDIVTTYISESQSAGEQVLGNEVLLGELAELLKKEEEQLVLQEAEQGRLNEILPTEIASLRARLVDNLPCPVCGSVDHPISGEDVDSIEQNALNEAKLVVSKDIERLTLSISTRAEEIIRLKSVVESYKAQRDKTFEKISEIFTGIPGWQVKYDNRTLSGGLKVFAAQWQENVKLESTFAENLNLQVQGLKLARDRERELSESLALRLDRKSSVASELSKLQDERKLLFEGQGVDALEKLHNQRVTDNNVEIKKVTQERDLLVGKGEKISGVIIQMTTSIAALTGNISLLEGKVSDWLAAREDDLSFEDLRMLFSKDNAWLLTERESLGELRKAELSAQNTLQERERMLAQHDKAEIKPSGDQTREMLITSLEGKTQSLAQKNERRTEIGVILVSDGSARERIKQFEEELEQKGSLAENWRKLNDLFGSADGAKFKVLAQGYTLDVLLGYANNHLKEISKRYLLERASPDSLSLLVIDLDMLSEVRSVHSLSGGESFLISLALALGLSSLSSNRMRVESLFIDEGFGTLDAETLGVAMDALESLQTQGRKIGVISHVTEMTERIATQIRVIKDSNGRSHIEVV